MTTTTKIAIGVGVLAASYAVYKIYENYRVKKLFPREKEEKSGVDGFTKAITEQYQAPMWVVG